MRCRKERTDHKFRANFELFMPNTHCKHIVLGCSNDHGYIPMLDPYKNDKRARGRITLLRAGKVAQGYHELPFATTCFVGDRDLLKSSSTLNILTDSGNTSPRGSITRQPTPPTSPTDMKSSKVQLSGGLMSPRSPSDETRNQVQQQRYIYPRPIAVNKKMERVDQDLPPVSLTDSRALADRLKNARVKPCHEFNLSGRCSIIDCQYDHQRLLPPAECAAYARKTRTKSCRTGSKCSNEGCMYGHMCQLDGKGFCRYGDICHFKMFHGMDTTVFKEYPITKNGLVNKK